MTSVGGKRRFGLRRPMAVARETSNEDDRALDIVRGALPRCLWLDSRVPEKRRNPPRGNTWRRPTRRAAWSLPARRRVSDRFPTIDNGWSMSSQVLRVRRRSRHRRFFGIADAAALERSARRVSTRARPETSWRFDSTRHARQPADRDRGEISDHDFSDQTQPRTAIRGMAAHYVRRVDWRANGADDHDENSRETLDAVSLLTLVTPTLFAADRYSELALQ